MDVAAAIARDIPVTNVSDTFSEEVADHAMLLDLECRCRVGQEIALVLTGYWLRSCVNPSMLEKIGLVRWQP